MPQALHTRILSIITTPMCKSIPVEMMKRLLRISFLTKALQTEYQPCPAATCCIAIIVDRPGCCCCCCCWLDV